MPSSMGKPAQNSSFRKRLDVNLTMIRVIYDGMFDVPCIQFFGHLLALGLYSQLLVCNSFTFIVPRISPDPHPWLFLRISKSFLAVTGIDDCKHVNGNAFISMRVLETVCNIWNRSFSIGEKIKPFLMSRIVGACKYSKITLLSLS